MDFKNKMTAALAVSGLVTAFGAAAAQAHEIRSLQCGPQDNAHIQQSLEVIDQLYDRSVSMTGADGKKFTTYNRKDGSDHSLVVSEFADDTVCFAPIPPELQP